jgi:small subunit ribosomal protein S7
MSRKKRDYKRPIDADPKFGDKIVSKFINCMMWNGKKSLSSNIFYGALDNAAKRVGKEPIQIFQEAMANVRPVVEVRSRRVGGANYQVPTEVRPERRDALAIRWLIAMARDRSEKSMTEKLCGEFLDASQNRGNAVKKKEDTHKMAEANRAFAHYRW